MSVIYRAIAKSMGGKYLAYGVQFGALMLLSRLFNPETFGVIAAVQVFFIFFQLMAEAGLAPAVIALDKLSSHDRDGIFGFTILVGVTLGAGFLIAGPT